MNTLIMRETTRLLVALILMFSVFMLLRGHDQPGGGFVGGLIASIAFCLYLFVADAAAVRRLLRADPSTVGAVGLGMAIASGFGWLRRRGRAIPHLRVDNGRRLQSRHAVGI